MRETIAIWVAVIVCASGNVAAGTYSGGTGAEGNPYLIDSVAVSC